MADNSQAAQAAPAEGSASLESSESSELEAQGSEEQAEGAQEPAKEAAKEEAKKEAVAAAKRKLQAKVNGKNVDVEIDVNDDKELLKYVQKAMAADEKFNEASSMKKQMELFIQELRSNPRAILAHPDLGIDIKKLAEQVLLEELEDSQKTPEQKEQEKMAKELEALRKQLEDEKNEKRNIELQKLKEQQFQQFDTDMTEALSASSLPKSPYVVKRIADTLIEAVEMGYSDINVKDIMPFVENQIQDEIKQMFEAMPTEVLEKVIGKNHLNNMRKARVAKAKPAVTPSAIKDSGEAKKEEKKEDQKSMKFSDVFGRF